MIEKQTVLILGAGASAEYGFPVGYRLCENICRGGCGAPPLPPHQEKIFRQDADRLFQDFRTQLRQSGQLSVDAFLETRPDLVDYGKGVMACELIPFENEETLFAPSPETGDCPRWYQLLLKKLGNKIDTFGDNRLSVLTFNYDRSFEHFLVVALSRMYSLSRSKTWEYVQPIPIHHLYGSLGEYTANGGNGRAYDGRVSYQSVKECVKSIRILREGSTHDEVFASAHEILQKAEVVVILGFGFDRTNLGRLKINLVPDSTRIYASAFGMTSRERDRAQDLIGRPITFGEEHQGNTAFLRNHVTWE